MRLSPALRRKIQRALSLDSNPEADVDELNAVLLQIALALMLVFMIVVFLFIQNTGGEISRVEELKQQLESAKREKLLHALEQVAEIRRVRYGLKAFQQIDPVSGTRRYDLSGIVEEGKFSGAKNPRNSFRIGGRAAFADYSEPDELEARWRAEALRFAAMTEEKLPAELRNWLTAEVRRQCAMVRGEVEELQALAAAALQSHFARHPEQVRDPAVRALLDRIAAEPAGTARDLLLSELAARLKTHVYAELRRIGDVPMLENLR